MADNLENDFGTAIEILDGKMDDSLTFHISKRDGAGVVFFIGIGLLMLFGSIFNLSWFPEKADAIFGAFFFMSGLMGYFNLRQRMRENHLIRYARHLEERLTKD